MDCQELLQCVMEDSDYNVSEEISLDEEENSVEHHLSTIDMLDDVQVCFSLYFNGYFNPFYFFLNGSS